ncbi:transcriptional regulator, marr family [hydrocarbon metagenome]|uniref:Transcriptional regulator, marr family n=1 Tax=hydrocarbon metagenome TaxID=938273 RepID=A0A0W8G0F1_9ZZZZ
MKLEEEIKQEKFKSELHKLAVNIIYTHSWLNYHQIRLLVKYNLTPQQYNILRILRGQHPNPATVNLLKERMLDKMSDASRLVERLRIKDLVERKNCKEDRRRAEVIITEKGLEVLQELDIFEDKFQFVFKNIGEDEAKVVNDLLDKIRG